MTLNLTRYLNKTIYVSMPALFDDFASRPFRFLGAELTGLWLQSAELTRRLAPDDDSQLTEMNPVVFVPYSQMAGVIIATSAPDSESHKPQPVKPATPSKTQGRPLRESKG
jgi:hypothetical protein